jgi:hypothetical protein
MPVLSVTTTQASSRSRPMLEAAVSGNAKLMSFDGACIKGIDLLSLLESEHLVNWGAMEAAYKTLVTEAS